MKVLLSIKPEYVERIFNGTKKFEYRKILFKNPDVKTVVIYSTKPVGMIVGEFDIGNILVGTPANIWDKTKKFSGVKEVFFDEYFGNRKKAVAIEVTSLKKYRKPICPFAKLTNFTAPQSFMYMTKEISDQIKGAM